jgi:hypothetical protein
MARRIRLTTHLSVGELKQRYRAAHEPHERTWWQILWLLALGQTATAIAESTGYTCTWIGQIAKRDNAEGPAGMVNRQNTPSWRAPRLLSAEQQEERRQALAGRAPDGSKQWTCRAVADRSTLLLPKLLRQDTAMSAVGGSPCRRVCPGCKTWRLQTRSTTHFPTASRLISPRYGTAASSSTAQLGKCKWHTRVATTHLAGAEAGDTSRSYDLQCE